MQVNDKFADVSGGAGAQQPIERAALEQRLARMLEYRQLDPDNVRLARECAELCGRAGDPAQARMILAEALDRFGDDAPLLFQLATVEMGADDPRRACELLQRVLGCGVDNGGVRHNLAYAQGLLGEFPAALDTLAADWPRTCREVPGAPLLKARLQHHVGDVAGAILTLRDFLLVEPASIEAHGDLALLLVDSEDYDSAALHAQRALADGGDNYAALLARGMVALARDDAAAARAVFASTVLRREERGRSWLGLGLCDLAMNELPRAEASLAEAVRLMPGYAGARATLAWAQVGLGRLDAAEATLREAIALDPEFGAFWGTLALVQGLRGDVDAARSSIAEADVLPLGSLAAAYAEDLIGRHHGDAEAALATLQQALSHPDGQQDLLAQLQVLRRGATAAAAPALALPGSTADSAPGPAPLR